MISNVKAKQAEQLREIQEQGTNLKTEIEKLSAELAKLKDGETYLDRW